jgi:biopolymer transport protein ExbD
MALEIERKRYNQSFISIAPLVDIIFLLLLFFLLTSHIIKESAVRVTLPESETATAEIKDVPTIFITKEETVYIMNIKVKIEALKDEIAKVIKDRKVDAVQIKADKDADVGILISVIDEVRLAGIRNYSIITERR